MDLASKVTYSRFVFGIIALFFAFKENIIFFSVFYSIAVLTDILDGYLARRLKTSSEKGKMLDIIADDFLVACVFLGLYLLGKLTHIALFALILIYFLSVQAMSYIAKKRLIFMRTLAANLAAISFPLVVFSMLFFEAEFIFKIYAFLMFYSLTEKLALMLSKKWVWLVFVVLLFIMVQLGPKACFDECLDIEIRDTAPERSLGLMYRQSLSQSKAMLFVFEEPGRQDFWMKNMKIPIDMIFISENFQVIKIYSDVQPCSGDPCEIYSADDAKYVLETAANYSLKKDISIGEKVKIFI
ncbi:MAG: DUF192 domain-containing protein [Candidatus Woesearchaeota archaeon]|nr:DUF192 domain-containing protein [Candidatus Woesearchaeota archaeon]